MLTYTPHEKLRLRGHPQFNEAWLHDRICEDPSILGLGEVRVLDRERRCSGGGRLDILLYDEEDNRRYEVEIMLGSTDPSHIVRTIEYWDIERRRYPGYEHVAVLIAEDITTRFLNVMSLLSGSIPLIAIQLDALKFGQHVLLNFVQVLDQTDLRIDDTEEDSGGGQVDRSYWDKKAGPVLMRICDEVLAAVNAANSFTKSESPSPSDNTPLCKVTKSFLPGAEFANRRSGLIELIMEQLARKRSRTAPLNVFPFGGAL